MIKKYDYLIIGQGIAGSSFAWTSYFNKKSFIILDSQEKNSASNAALGIYNPITGRRNSLTWNVEKLFNSLEEFYLNVEKTIKKNILFKKKIYRPFKDNRDYNDWNLRLENDKFKKYLSKIDSSGILTCKSGYLDVSKYLSETRKYFKSIDRYKNYKLSNNQVIIKKNRVIIKEFDAKNVIMCLGINQLNINYLNKIPLRAVSGNSIIAETNFNSNHIINKKISVINTSRKNIHAGSTYHNGFENNGVDKLLNKLDEIIKKEYKVKKINFGIRSASVDRKPLVGKHPTIDNLYIINGLGSKGVSQSPYCSKELFNYIELNKNLDKEINIERFIT